jgi:hypothetical protein
LPTKNMPQNRCPYALGAGSLPPGPGLVSGSKIGFKRMETHFFG